MIVFRQLSLARGAKLLVRGVDLTLNRGERVGIVGANGSGKSSLFALLRAELHQDAGDLELPLGLAIASVAQETPALSQAAIDYVLDGDERFRAAEQAIALAEQAGGGTPLAEAHAQFDAIDGYSARARAAKVMHGLGFSPAELQQPVAQFSGGWRVRLNLARALTSPSELLLLDEPTNHLDLEAVLWLEEWLRRYQGTLLVISHDRDFLDGVAGIIWHFEDQRITRYSGNYSVFEAQRAAQLALRQAMYEKQQREIAHLRSFIDRFRAKATKARAAQSRIKALARMELITAAHVDSPFEFQFRAPRASTHGLLRLENVSAGYGATAVLSGVTLELASGMRLALLGPNGAGKSTFIKLLAGEIAPLAGERIPGKHLHIGYFAQHQLEQLRTDESALQHMLRADPKATTQELRDFLGGFDFRGDAADAPVRIFSGGEKARLVLALLIWQRPNLLLLDEPTNHLDLEMRQALTLALQEYAGALVLVAHDRHLLRTTTDSYLLVGGGTVERFDGDLEDYRLRLREDAQTEQPRSAAGESRRAERRREAQQRQQLTRLRTPVRKETEKVEAAIAALSREKSAIEATLGAADIYREQRKDELKALLLRQASVTAELARAEERWLELQTELEAIEGEAGS